MGEPRKRPWTTFELAEFLEVHPRTIARWCNDGIFGKEGSGWKWTSAGPGKGDRRISHAAVLRYLAHNA